MTAKHTRDWPHDREAHGETGHMTAKHTESLAT
jgi:hypothetical protein